MQQPAPQDFEGLGTFYLGARYDLERRERQAELALYDSKDLLTHAVVVGMTGSGKTGLGVVLLEEAALDGIPALVIDPKGDLANLLLAFPELRPADFEPWIDPDQARVKGVSAPELAAQTAEQWRSGLARWGQDGARIQRLKDGAEFALYTPGSSAGRQVSVLRSFAAPDAHTLLDAELLAERVQSTVSSLLGLAGVGADPLQSREHVLLSTLVHRAWTGGRDLDLGALVAEVQRPGIERIGVLDLESFYPAKERLALALALNNLLASPGFGAWMQGEPLDVDRLLYTPEGKPRVAIFSIAHLADAQRMFFVSLLLEQTLGWVRRQRGTSSLRALVYMDEIAGYFPPVANPPSKAPLLTLMKQARAFGVGVVLATQNPVDLDYKGLSNAGTWFVGRLQTERDKARLLDGLEGAAAGVGGGFERASMERALSSLGARVFLMNNVHDGQPRVFETRWALSYLRGPMTRVELRRLCEPTPATDAAPPANRATPAGDGALARDGERSLSAPRSVQDASPLAPAAARGPVLSDVTAYYLPSRTARAAVEYRPAVLGMARVRFTDTRLGLDEERSVAKLAFCGPGPVPLEWDEAETVELSERDLRSEPDAEASFAPLPPELARSRAYDGFRRSFAEHVFRHARLELLESELTGLVSAPGESERDFRLRALQHAREERDAALEKLRAKYAPKLAALEERRRKRQQAVEVQAQQARGAKVSTALTFGTALLAAFLGGRRRAAGHATRAASTARGVNRSLKESSDVERAQADLAGIEQQLQELEQRLQADVEELSARYDPARESLRQRTVAPRKSAVSVRSVALTWAPYSGGDPLWR